MQESLNEYICRFEKTIFHNLEQKYLNLSSGQSLSSLNMIVENVTNLPLEQLIQDLLTEFNNLPNESNTWRESIQQIRLQPLQWSSSRTGENRGPEFGRNILREIQDELIDGDYFINPKKPTYQILMKFVQVVDELSISFDNLSSNLESLQQIKNLIRSHSFEEVVKNKFQVFAHNPGHHTSEFSSMIKDSKTWRHFLQSEIERIFEEKLLSMFRQLEAEIENIKNADHSEFLKDFKVYKTYWENLSQSWSTFFQLIQVFSMEMRETSLILFKIEEHFGLNESDFNIFLDFEAELRQVQEMQMPEAFENVFAMHKFFNEWIRQCEVFLSGGSKSGNLRGFDSNTRKNIVEVLRSKCARLAEHVSQMMVINAKDYQKEHWNRFLNILGFAEGRKSFIIKERDGIL